MNYEKDIEIDPDALDIAWLEQPRLMLEYCQNAARMRRKVEEAKQYLDVTKAEVDRVIRDKPLKYLADGKITVDAVAAAVLTHPRYQEAVNLHLEAKYESDMSSVAVSAFDHRKAALENLVRLYGQQYFAGPKIPRDINHEWEQRQAQRSADKKVGVMTRKHRTE